MLRLVFLISSIIPSFNNFIFIFTIIKIIFSKTIAKALEHKYYYFHDKRRRRETGDQT